MNGVWEYVRFNASLGVGEELAHHDGRENIADGVGALGSAKHELGYCKYRNRRFKRRKKYLEVEVVMRSHLVHQHHRGACEAESYEGPTVRIWR